MQLIKILFTDHMALYYMKELIIRCQTSIILLGEGEKHGEKEKDHLDIASYYCGSTKDPVLIRDPAFNFVIMLFPQPLNGTRRLYETACNLRQYGNTFSRTLNCLITWV